MQSNDKDFKQELGKLVDLSIWAQAREMRYKRSWFFLFKAVSSVIC